MERRSTLTESMLTEEEKSRVRAEEIFRAEILRDLQANKPRSNHQRLWTLLNSSFALWFLSSVVLAGLTTAVTYYQAKRGEHLRKAELERRLDTEISGRIALARRGAHLDEKRIAQGADYSTQAVYNTAQFYLDNSFITGSSHLYDFSLYPEYQTRTFRSLVFELRSVVDSADRPELTDVLAVYEKLLDLGSQINGKNEKATQQTAQSVIEILDRLTKSRWLSLQGAQEASN